MGTASTKKFIKNSAGALTEEAALLDSVGAGDANRIPALNAAGILDDSIINAAAAGGGGSANKIAKLTAGGILAASIVNSVTTSAGAGDAAKVVALDAAGRIDSTMMPVGIGADTATITTSEALSAGDLINIHNSTGAKVRKADATTAGREAHGFVLAGFGSATSATVYFEGTNTGVTGLTPGPQFLSTTPGLATVTAPSAAGNVVQRVGVATGATSLNFEGGVPITLV